MTEAIELGLPAQAFDRQDDGDDLCFYARPRLVTHIDEAAVGALTSLYRDAIPAGGRVLDLMSRPGSTMSGTTGDATGSGTAGSATTGGTAGNIPPR